MRKDDGPRKLRSAFRRFKKTGGPLESGFGEHYHKALRAIAEERDQLWNPRIPTRIQAYFEDMKAVFRMGLRKRAGSCQRMAGRFQIIAMAGIEITRGPDRG